MKKNVVTLVLCAFAFGVGFGLNNVAFSSAAAPKIAYINVSKLLQTSKVLKAAEDQRTRDTKEMLKWYDNASAEIQKQTSASAKQNMVKKYEADLTKKKKAIKDAYSKKVVEVDKQLDTVISQKAKSLGYTLVLRKDSVLFGGDDITNQIVPLVK